MISLFPQRIGFCFGNSPANLASVWWVCAGLVALLPIHAAGNHEGESRGNTISCVVSSYAPTLKALQFGRSKSWTAPHAPDTPLTQERKVLVVSVPEVPGYDKLHVEKEVEAIKTQIGAQAVEVLNCPTSSNLVAKLRTSNIVHFVCHGKVRLHATFSQLSHIG